MGIGFGLMVLIGFTGESPAHGVGVGGFLVIMGFAFFINSLFDSRNERSADPRPVSPPSASSAPPDAPPQVVSRQVVEICSPRS